LSANLLLNDIGIDQAKDLVGVLKEHPTLKTLCGNSGNETELDMSGKMRGAGDAIMLVPDIIDNGALSIANVMGNRIGKEMLSKLQEIMRSKPNLVSLCGIADDATGADLSSLGMDADDAIILASELPDKGAILSLNLAKNVIRAEGAKHIFAAIKGHKTLTILDISGNEIGAYSRDNNGRSPWIGSPEGPIAIADAIKDMEALTALNIAGNNLGEMALPEGWSCGYHGDYSGDEFYKHKDGRKMKNGIPEGTTSGAIVIAAVIPDMGAMTRLDISANCLGAAGTKALTEGLKGNQLMTELDMSSNSMGKAGAIALADIIPGMGALSILNLASNSLGEIVLAEGWSYDEWNLKYKHTDGREQTEKPGKPEGIIAIANAIPDMGALSELDARDNRIPPAEKALLQCACDAKGVSLRV
jgi:hypothetical protein